MVDEQGSAAFLVYRDEGNRERTFALNRDRGTQRIGRGEAAHLRLHWDREVSRVHAELEPLGKGWVLVDDGLSSNGTSVNGERLLGRRRLETGDEIRVGTTTIRFRSLDEPGSQTYIPALAGAPVELSPLQRQVLIALCRPYRDTETKGTPATNQQIAEETHLSVAGVKSHLRTLFSKFGIADLPQNQKRARLVLLAFERGYVSKRDLVG